jgi:hypothetical protein
LLEERVARNRSCALAAREGDARGRRDGEIRGIAVMTRACLALRARVYADATGDAELAPGRLLDTGRRRDPVPSRCSRCSTSICPPRSALRDLPRLLADHFESGPAAKGGNLFPSDGQRSVGRAVRIALTVVRWMEATRRS